MKVNERKNILLISGLDPSGQAGVIVDIETVFNLRCNPLAAIATNTVQNKNKVTAGHAIDSMILHEQLSHLIKAHPIHAVKIGLLVQKESAHIIKTLFEEMHVPIIFDPVYQSSTGYYFTSEKEFNAIAHELSSIVTLITPNKLEAEALSKIIINEEIDFQKAAQEIGYKNILIKGGHFTRKNNDFFYSRGKAAWIEGSERQFILGQRGAGCRLSTAIACFSAEDESLEHAIKHSKAYLESVI